MTILNNGHLNLFSISQMLNNGLNLIRDEESITSIKDGMEIVFDIKIPTRKGMLYATKIKRDQENCCAIGTETTTNMSVENDHCKLGHMSVHAKKAVANTMKWKFTSDPEICKTCAENKGKKKNIIARTQKKSNDKGYGRIFLDIGLVNNTEYS